MSSKLYNALSGDCGEAGGASEPATTSEEKSKDTSQTAVLIEKFTVMSYQKTKMGYQHFDGR
jgi:hypothetical protein